MLLSKRGVRPESGEVIVTGSTGGVGSIAIAVLAQLGFKVVAVTGKLSEESYLQSLGA
jgi:acrylyl-CoA reductase (NADPH)